MSEYAGLDPYEVLGINPEASEDEIRSAWREAARTHHPDAGGDAEIFKRAQWAFDAIASGAARSRERRKTTERQGAAEEPEARGTVPHDGEPGERIMVEVMIEHATAVFGGTARTTRWRLTHCPTCGGAGSQCSQCTGDGRIGGYHTSIITIPPRTGHGDVIRLIGEGDAGRRRRNESGRGISNAGPYGELQVRILVARATWIVEVGDDLRTETTIDVYDAILGGETRVKGLDGTYPLTIPPGVQPGQQLRLSGRGRPREGSGRGDLIVVVHVEIPQQLGATEASTLATLRRERQMRIPRKPW